MTHEKGPAESGPFPSRSRAARRYARNNNTPPALANAAAQQQLSSSNLAELATTAPCDDCGAQGEHESSCPVLAGFTAQIDADRNYFATHPGVGQYTRALCHAEGVLLRSAQSIPPGGKVVGTVRVVELSPGVRVRHYQDTLIVFDPIEQTQPEFGEVFRHVKRSWEERA